MSTPPGIWQRLKKARVVRVLIVYLGASWVVLQVTSTVVQAFKLPDQVLPSAIILMAAGLVVVLATAWVQARPETTAGEETGALPTDWQIAPRDAIASIRSGRIPHLTWGRAVAGGVVVLSLLFGGAGTYVGFVDGRLGRPAQVSASEVADGIAVVPFEARGSGMEIWREGMMDLLTNGLDGVGGFRTIDSRTVMARWKGDVGEKAADLAATISVAKATGARYVLEGSVVALGPSVRLSANVYDVDSGKQVAKGVAEGPAADVLRLVDELAVQTMRNLLSAVGREGETDASAETITTKSLPAMRDYLEGERHFRKGKFADAVQSYERAVAADSTFAIALVRLAEAYGWLESQNSAKMIEVGKRAYAQRDRLSPRYQFIMKGWEALERGSPDGVASLKDAVRKYPDDARAWFLWAETIIHVGGSTYGTSDELWEALTRATTLDPRFAPYYVHVAETAVLRGDRAAATKAVEEYRRLSGGAAGVEHIELAIPLLLGNDAEVTAAMDAADTVPPELLDTFLGTFARRHDHFDRDAVVDSIFGAKSHTDRRDFQAYHAVSRGGIARGNEVARDAATKPVSRAIYFSHVTAMWNAPLPADVSPSVCTTPTVSAQCSVIVGIGLADAARWNDHQQLIARLREAVSSAPDTARKRVLAAAAGILDGAGMRRRGNLEAARIELTKYTYLTAPVGDRARLELGFLELDAKRPAEALRHFNSVLEGFVRPAALFGAATAAEQMKQPAEARNYWQHFVTLTKDADNGIPRVTYGRQALARYSGEPGRR